QLLLRGSIRREQRRVCVVYDALELGEYALQPLEVGIELGYELLVGAGDELAHIRERRVQGLQVLLERVADRLERHLVDLVENARELRFEVKEGAGDHWKLGRVGIPLDLCSFGGMRIVVEGDVELPGEEAAGPQLGAQTALLDQALDDRAPAL